MSRLLLITGIPCTGKTHMGNHLADAHGFVHLDVEEFITSGRAGEFPVRAQTALDDGSDVVVTWGFWPGKDDQRIRALQHAGFRLVWFDGDRALARRLFIERERPPVEYFDEQLVRIEGMNLAAFGPTVIDPFTPEGGRVPRERLAEMLLGAAAQSTPEDRRR